MLHNPALLLVGGQALESQGIIDTWAAEVSGKKKHWPGVPPRQQHQTNTKELKQA